MYQNYGQTDPRWAGQRLGTVDGVTIGQAGCYVTADANVASHFGKDTNPADLDNWFTDNNVYVDGDLLADDALTKRYADIAFTGVYNCQEMPCDLSVFNEFNNYEHEAIIELDASAAPGVQTHFCRFYDYDPQTGVVRIVDSEDGQIVSIADRYGDPKEFILKVVKFVGPALFVAPPVPQPAITPVADATPIAVTPDPAPVEAPPVVTPVPEPTPVPVVPPTPSVQPTAPVPVSSPLPSRDSATGRALHTALQTALALAGAALLDPNLLMLLNKFAPGFVYYLPVTSGAISFLANFFRVDVKNY